MSGPTATFQPLAVRFASTAPVPNIPPTITPNTAPVLTAPGKLSDDWAVSLDNLVSSDLLPLEEHIGYLKALGLDYGWGPTACIEYLLEHIHVWTHTPWWASIILSAFFVRLTLFKLNINAADQAGRMAAAQPKLKPLQEKVAAAKASRDTQTMMLVGSQIRAIMKAEGVSYAKLLGPFVQIPLGYGTFRLLQGMSALPVPGLDDGGLLWIQDLTVSDPLFSLPVVTSVVMYLTFKVCLHWRDHKLPLGPWLSLPFGTIAALCVNIDLNSYLRVFFQN